MVVGLQKWTDLIGMGIEEALDENDADLKFYITTENVGYLGAQFGPHSAPYQGTGIYVRYSGNTWTNSLEPGGYGFITIIHELGHALGLAHPHDTGCGSSIFPGVTSSSSLGSNDLNQNIYIYTVTYTSNIVAPGKIINADNSTITDEISVNNKIKK